MAYGGGIFLPSETAYKDPNRFRDVLQAEGNKEAKYLSAMDQFYEELNEMKRQFNVTAEMQERFHEEELAFGREKLEWQSGESELDRSLKRWAVGQEVGVQREALGVERYKAEMAGRTAEAGQELGFAELGLERDRFSEQLDINRFARTLYAGKESREQEAHTAEMKKLGGAPTTTQVGYTGAESYYSPYSNQSISDYLGDVGGGGVEESYQQFGDWKTY